MNLGYGSVIRQKRIEAYMEMDSLSNWVNTSGSKAEGLTCTNESDRDLIMACPNAVCLEDGIDERTIQGHITVFKMNMPSCNAGYCRPLLLRLSPTCHPAIPESLCADGYGRFLLSSTYFVDHLKKYNLPIYVNHARAGPSLPWTSGPNNFDAVRALRCHCPVILQKWASRARQWPSPDIVEKATSMGAFVTPIGFKGSEPYHIAWRICFNTAEVVLVNNLNDTQVKIYVLLKMIVNDVLKPKAKEITSYLLKNIVLWLEENNPQTLFDSGSLFHWLLEGLGILRTAISFSQLPYYMIPERNLMTERRLDVEQQHVFVSSITNMIDEGPRILMRLKKVRQAVICHPEPLLWYSTMRTELEMLDLELMFRLTQCTDENLMVDETVSIIHACAIRQGYIAREVLCRMRLEGSSVNDVIKVLNRTFIFTNDGNIR
ncbi:hypothetical protein DPMN_037796 [Dreissena polymorpha]|uniref:Mab-21-like HhH/H2TH-like domain-containing protein n=1 Tax=Dreissena polymorpha TaxID=45954 RepID=A0A9D4MBZ8_DREPO|nr:hypothetical protein DPMN_037796 [Dreissena polymorpha]